MEIHRPDTPACNIPNTTEAQTEDHEMTDACEPPNPFPSSLGTLVDNDMQYSPDISQTPGPTPASQLHALIEAERFPPGQRAMFEAIDALRFELSVDDAMAGLRTALALLRETLTDAIDDPSEITRRPHLRIKLREEYDALPAEVTLWNLVMDAAVVRIKEWVGRRWALEAMGGAVESVQL